jgi:hypothetical protein
VSCRRLYVGRRTITGAEVGASKLTKAENLGVQVTDQAGI